MRVRRLGAKKRFTVTTTDPHCDDDHDDDCTCDRDDDAGYCNCNCVCDYVYECIYTTPCSIAVSRPSDRGVWVRDCPRQRSLPNH